MTEFGLGTSLQIAFKLLPETLIVPDFLAPGADGYQALKGLDFVEG